MSGMQVRNGANTVVSNHCGIPIGHVASPQNLDVDLAPWREPRRRANLTVWGMAAWVRERLPPRNSQRWVLLRAGRVLTLGKAGEWIEECERPCDRLLHDILASELLLCISALVFVVQARGMRNWVQRGMRNCPLVPACAH